MKRVSVTATVLSALCFSASACSSSPDAAQAPASAADPATADPYGSGPAAGAVDSPLDAACDATFDALLARTAKCGPGSTMNLVPVERSRASFKKLCAVQGGRPGTGYTAAYRKTCAETLASAACADDDTVVKACWEPRGALARGLPCSTDDQCKDGLCELPGGALSGSSCGVCGPPVWKQASDYCDESDKDKCEPATVCETYSASSRRTCLTVLGHALGEECNSGVCRFGVECKGPTPYRCVKGAARAAAGGSCGAKAEDARCEFGTACDRSSICVNVPTLDEPAGKTDYRRDHCDSWTAESATGKCIVQEALSCD